MARISGRSLSRASRMIMPVSPLPRKHCVSYSVGMSTKMDDPTPRIAARLKEERETRGWSLGDLADRSGVSRAMISKIERGESSPTATLLGRLSGAFGLTLSAMLARAELQSGRLLRAADQPLWKDPETVCGRRRGAPAAGGPGGGGRGGRPAGAERAV